MERLVKLTELFLRFALVGGVAAFVQYISLVFLVEVFSTNAVFASTLGFVLGAYVNYRMNYSFTYRSSLPHKVVLPRFAVTATVGLIINTIVMIVCSELLSIYYLISQILATGVTLAWNFCVNTAWSFRGDDPVSTPDSDRL